METKVGDIVEYYINENNEPVHNDQKTSTKCKGLIIGKLVTTHLVQVFDPCKGWKLAKPDIHLMDSKIEKIEDYIGKPCFWMNFEFIISVNPYNDIGGCVCKLCNVFSFYSQPNQEDKTFICYPCRQDPYRGCY